MVLDLYVQGLAELIAAKENLRSGQGNAAADLAQLAAQAWRFKSQGDLHASAACCSQVLHQSADHDEAWHLLGLLQWDLGDRHTAIAHLRQAIRLQPDQALHHNTLGGMLIETENYVEAEKCLGKALALSPEFYEARCNLGLALYHQNRLTQALDCFRQVLSAQPEYWMAWANLGLVQLTLGDMHAAASAYENALRGHPGQTRWQANLGAAYLALGRFAEAARCFQKTLEAHPDHPEYGLKLGIALRASGEWSESIRILEHVLSLTSNHGPVLANLAVVYQQTCQWHKLARLYRRLDHLTRTALAHGALPDEQPLLNIRRCKDPQINLAVARAWSREAERRALQIAAPFAHPSRARTANRITIGYLSYDFRNHPVAHQLAPLFGLHDRNRFCVKAFSMGPDDGSVFRREIQKNSDQFFDIRDRNLIHATGEIVDSGVDILVDLMGHTHHNRLEILALKPAPIQVAYLGFLSSSGAGFIDYIIADAVVAPHEHGRFYSEKIIRMPHCYQMIHRAPPGQELPPSRRQWHLPEKGFVFCSFNQLYKIESELFAAWMRILHQMPRAVLWLVQDHPAAIAQLRLAAEAAHIDPQRIIFAEPLPLAEHLQRLQLADLALDTLTYNGGATTANCLCSGVPVLTLLGRHWVSRMSASHLFSAGLPELVVNDLAGYEQAAVALAREPQRLATLRRRLLKALSSAPLFSPRKFVESLENAYETIWERYLKGLAPIDIEPGP
jgi:protein O-GlcNAc transferase